MAIRRILELGDPMLRRVSTEVVDPRLAIETLTDLRDTLHEFRRVHGFGRGIAAIQIGVSQRVIYIEVEGVAYEVIDPRLTELSADTLRMWDDCFSFPNLMVRLERSRRVKLTYQDRDGVNRVLDAENGLAELLQHEVDHLDGVLAIDRALDLKTSFMTRSEFLRKA